MSVVMSDRTECSHCRRWFKGTRGLQVHLRHCAPRQAEANVVVERVHKRWTKEEEYLVACKELELEK